MYAEDEKAFRKCHLFNGIPNEAISDTISLLRPTVAAFPSGSVIFHTDEFSPALIYILSGSVSVERKEGGKRVLLNTLESCDCFGAASMFGAEEEFPTKVIARGNVRIAAVNEDGLTALFLAHPKSAVNHIRYLSEKIRFLNKKIGALTGRDAESKVANYILKVYGKSALQQKLNMAETSRKLDMGRASLYRIITRFNDAEIIHYQNGFIEIKNMKELERLSK